MKKLSLLLIAFLCPFIISAQEVFQTNFQTEEEFQQWLVVDNNADEKTWQFDSYADPSHVFYSYHATNAADDWFISPAITSAETGTLALNFSVQGSSYGEKIEVFYGMEQTAEAMTNRLSDVIYLPTLDITHHLCLINVNANEPVYVGFRACSDSDKWRLYLCEVKALFTSNPVDIQAAEFVAPVSDFGLDQETVTVKVKNTGGVDVNSFDISFSVDDVTIATETVNQPLAVGGEMEYTFTAKANLSVPRKTFALKAWTTHPDDISVANDACEVMVLHKAPATVPYVMGFEDDEYTDGITMFNLNEDEGNWDLYTDTWYSLAHTGDYCLAYNYDINNNADDWAILEPITVEEPGYYMLRFWYSGDDSHLEKLAVYYGNEAKPESMTNKIVEYAPFARGEYEESINILYFDQPQNIHIGFYAFSNKDKNYIYVDDVVFEKVNTESIDLAVLPITNPQQYVHKGSKKDVSFAVRNIGVTDVTSALRVMIDEETIYEEEIEFKSQEIKDIVLGSALKNLAAGKHEISIEVLFDADVNIENNKKTFEFQVLENPVMSWDFEDGQHPADFTFRVKDGGTVNPSAGEEFNEYGWGIFNIPQHELYGEHLLAGTSWLNGTDRADRWCILPPFTPSAESYLVWDVASFNPNFLESYAVMISTNGDDSWYYFTEEEIVFESAEFKTRGIDLSEYSGRDIYIAFRLRSENCEHLILDNIEFYGGAAVEFLDITATVDPEEGMVDTLDRFTVTFENVESVAIDEDSYNIPYIALVRENNYLEQIAAARLDNVDSQARQLSLYIEEDEMTEITDDGKYALVIPRKYLVFNDDPLLLVSAKEFVFYYEIIKYIESPSNLKVDSISSSSVTLSWDEVENAMWYEIYSADTLVGGVTGTSLTITDLTAGTEYSFIVAAVRNEQVMKSEAIVVKTLEAEPEQPEQPGDSLVLAAPVVVVDTVTETTVVLLWNAVDSATSYNVYMDSVLVKNVTDTTYTVDGLTAETTYSFTVTAVADTLESAASKVVEVTTLKAEQPEEPGEGVEELEASFSIYPNPVNDKLYIETLTQTQTLTIEIYDVYGRRQELSVISCQPSAIDVSNLNSGVYFVKVITDEGEVVKRIVKN